MSNINKQGQQQGTQGTKGPTAGWDKGNLNKDKGQQQNINKPNANTGKQDYNKQSGQQGGFGQQTHNKDKGTPTQR